MNGLLNIGRTDLKDVKTQPIINSKDFLNVFTKKFLKSNTLRIIGFSKSYKSHND